MFKPDRLQVRRAGVLMRLFTRGRFDWSGRDTGISAAVARLVPQSVALNGEAVACGPDGGSGYSTCCIAMAR